MPFRYGVVRLEVPIMIDGVNVGTANIEDDGTIVLEYRGGYKTVVNELAEKFILGQAMAVKLEAVLVEATPVLPAHDDKRPTPGMDAPRGRAFQAYQEGRFSDGPQQV